jgi:hypothetical protein
VVAGLVLLSANNASAQPAPAPPPAPAPAPAPAELPAPPPGEEAAPPAGEAAPPAEEAAPAQPPAEEPPAEEAAPTAPSEEPLPAEEEAAPGEDVVAPEAAEPVEEAPSYRVSDEEWTAAMEQKVTVEVDDAEPLRGKLVATTPAAAVVVGDDGNVHTLQKADVASLAVDAPEPEPEEPPTSEASTPEEEPKKEEPADWKKFGVFTSHGISYAHWRTSLYRAGAAAYAGDLGVGYNWSRPWGAYLVIGGHAGARLVDRTIKGNFGHLAGMFRYRGKKRFVGMFGLSLAWSKLEEPTRRVRDVSVSIPLKAMATFNVADSTYIGVGIGYEPGFFAQGRIANALSFQATLAHW